MSIVIENAIAALPTADQNEWAELQRGAHDPLDTLSSWRNEHRRAVTLAWSDWARAQMNAGVVLCEITKWSRKLGVQLACAVAREALRYIPENEQRPSIAIETAERWVRGEATKQECEFAAKSATYAAHDYADTRDTAIFDAAYASAYVADAASVDTLYAAYAATAAAYATADAYANSEVIADKSSKDWVRTPAPELHRLCDVIAEDMLTGRTAEWIR
jgi:hypothetical protein